MDVHALPIPRYDLLAGRPYHRYTLQTSRGCPWRCDFCASKVMLRQAYRKRRVDDNARTPAERRSAARAARECDRRDRRIRSSNGSTPFLRRNKGALVLLATTLRAMTSTLGRTRGHRSRGSFAGTSKASAGDASLAASLPRRLPGAIQTSEGVAALLGETPASLRDAYQYWTKVSISQWAWTSIRLLWKSPPWRPLSPIPCSEPQE